MSQSVAVLISEAQRALTTMLGVPLLWRGAQDPQLFPGQEESLYLHCNPFCLAIKAHEGRYAKCRPRESSALAAETMKHKQAFAKTCHGGVVEWVTPLFFKGVYEGSLILGPFRPGGKRCPYGELAAEFSRLPIFDAKLVEKVQPLLTLLAEFIIKTTHESAFLAIAQGKDRRLQQAAIYLETYYRQPCRVEEVARACGLSQSRLIHLFTQEFGVPLTTYLAQIRIREAKRLLIGTDLSLSAVAIETGFVDQSHLGAVFKRLTGQTPRKFRVTQREQIHP